MSVVNEFLMANGFEKYAEELDSDYSEVSELQGVTVKKIEKLGGNKEDHKRIMDAVNRYISQLKDERDLALEVLLNRLPIFIAIPYKDLLNEENPRQKAQRFFDVAELILRWCSAVFLSAASDKNDGDIPEDLVNSIKKLIKSPTFGIWIQILRETSKQYNDQYNGLAKSLADWVVACKKHGKEKKHRLDVIIGFFVSDRNDFLHSAGGGSALHWEDYCKENMPQLELIVEGLAGTLDEIEIIGIHGEHAHNLKGDKSAKLSEFQAGLTEGVWLSDKTKRLKLWPLVHFGHETTITAESNQIFPLCYISTKSKPSIKYLPLQGHSPIIHINDSKFYEFFTLDQSDDAILSRKFLELAKQDADMLTGRNDEINRLNTWIDEAHSGLDIPEEMRVGVVFGGPGMGKSFLISKIAANFDAKPKKETLEFYYHRFRKGGEGNTPDAFNFGLLSALGPNKDKNEDILEQLRKKLVSSSNFIILVDGLDEVAAYYPDFPKKLRNLASFGGIWLFASRKEGNIPNQMEPFSNIFENGLQPLSKNDIRAMLQETLPSAIKHKLIGRDIDDITNPEALPDNPYVNELLNMAEGNPLYVHFLVEDLEAEKTTVYNEKQLPQGLTEYYIKLMDSLNATDVGRTLPLIVAILACADEPLDRESLHDLVAEGELETVDEAIRYGNSMLSTQPTNDKKEGFTLYHSSLRDHVLSETSKLKGTVKEARKRILERAKDWDSMPSNSLRNHLFRCANSYAARWGDETMLQEAIGRLTNFEYLHARISTLAGRNLPRFLEEYNLCISKNHDVGLNNTLRSFQSFLRLEWDLIRNTGDDPENLGKGATQLVVAGCLSSSPVLDAAYDFAKKKKIPILLRKIGPYLQPYWRRSFPGNRGDCGAAKFSPDGKIVALAVKSKLWLLNSETGESVAEAELECNIQGLLFNTDEQIFACTREGPLNRISLMKVYENGELKECSHWVFECDRLGMSTTETGPMAVAMTFINDSTDIKISIYQLNLEKYSLLHEHKIKGINLKTSHKNNDVRQGLDTELQTNIALSFSGESIFIRLPGECDKNVRGEIRSINVKTGKDQWVVALSTVSSSGSVSRMFPLAVSLTGNYVAVVDGKDEILLIESRTGKVIWRAPAHYWGINSLAFSVDGLTLYSGGGDFCIKQWDCATGKVIRLIDQHSDRIACLAAGATGLVSIGMDGQAMRWILKDEEQPQFNRRLLPMGCLSLSISIDGRYVAAGGKANPYHLNRYPEYGTSCLAIADIENGKVIYPDGVNGAGAVSFFGDTDILCCCWRNPDKCFFDTKNERWLDIRLPEGFNPNLCAVSDDNHFLLLLSDAKPHQFIIFNTELEQIGSSVLGDGNVSYLAPSLGEGVFTIGLRDGENPLAVYLDSDGGLLIKEKASPEEKVAAGFTNTVLDQLSRSDKYAFSKKRDSDRLEVFSMINKNSIIALPIGIKARIIASKGDLVALGDDAGRVLLYQVEQWESEVN